jgi:hypothetical protein
MVRVFWALLPLAIPNLTTYFISDTESECKLTRSTFYYEFSHIIIMDYISTSTCI